MLTINTDAVPDEDFERDRKLMDFDCAERGRPVLTWSGPLDGFVEFLYACWCQPAPTAKEQ